MRVSTLAKIYYTLKVLGIFVTSNWRLLYQSFFKEFLFVSNNNFSTEYDKVYNVSACQKLIAIINLPARKNTPPHFPPFLLLYIEIFVGRWHKGGDFRRVCKYLNAIFTLNTSWYLITDYHYIVMTHLAYF